MASSDWNRKARARPRPKLPGEHGWPDLMGSQSGSGPALNAPPSVPRSRSTLSTLSRTSSRNRPPGYMVATDRATLFAVPSLYGMPQTASTGDPAWFADDVRPLHPSQRPVYIDRPPPTRKTSTPGSRPNRSRDLIPHQGQGEFTKQQKPGFTGIQVSMRPRDTGASYAIGNYEAAVITTPWSPLTSAFDDSFDSAVADLFPTGRQAKLVPTERGREQDLSQQAVSNAPLPRPREPRSAGPIDSGFDPGLRVANSWFDGLTASKSITHGRSNNGVATVPAHDRPTWRPPPPLEMQQAATRPVEPLLPPVAIRLNPVFVNEPVGNGLPFVSVAPSFGSFSRPRMPPPRQDLFPLTVQLGPSPSAPPTSALPAIPKPRFSFHPTSRVDYVATPTRAIVPAPLSTASSLKPLPPHPQHYPQHYPHADLGLPQPATPARRRPSLTRITTQRTASSANRAGRGPPPAPSPSSPRADGSPRSYTSTTPSMFWPNEELRERYGKEIGSTSLRALRSRTNALPPHDELIQLPMPDSRRLGMHRSTLILAVVLVFVVVSAVLAGVLGGSVAVEKAAREGYAQGIRQATVSTTTIWSGCPDASIIPSR